MKKIAILTSGGDAPGMNACIRSIVRYATTKNIEVLGFKRGYQGLIENDFEVLNFRSVGNILQLGGTILKTSRSEEFMTENGYKKALANLRKNKIEGLIVIGGDGSYKGAEKLADSGVKVIAIPASIDNDLYYTDYTIGFDSAVNTIIELTNNVRDTSLSHDRISVIEVMGAGCGDIALNVGIACGADQILVPEVKVDLNEVYRNIKSHYENGKKFSIIIVNEKFATAEEISSDLQNKVGLESRPLVVGHIQRGGSPSRIDRILATKFGVYAVDLLKNGETNKAIGVKAQKLITTDIEKALKGNRKFDIEAYRLAHSLTY